MPSDFLPEDLMAYNLEQFIADCRATLKRDPGPSGREAVRSKLETLLQQKDFIDRKSTRLNSSHSQQSRMPSSA